VTRDRPDVAARRVVGVQPLPGAGVEVTALLPALTGLEPDDGRAGPLTDDAVRRSGLATEGVQPLLRLHHPVLRRVGGRRDRQQSQGHQDRNDAKHGVIVAGAA
jgi:hypothetical protein